MKNETPAGTAKFLAKRMTREGICAVRLRKNALSAPRTSVKSLITPPPPRSL
ncbi:MAG: hypothetical protein LBH18_07835 [Spirochaetaceae bacterium]|nr:hypothetical protein [Spirochaetaceae bacterium]